MSWHKCKLACVMSCFDSAYGLVDVHSDFVFSISSYKILTYNHILRSFYGHSKCVLSSEFLSLRDKHVLISVELIEIHPVLAILQPSDACKLYMYTCTPFL